MARAGACFNRRVISACALALFVAGVMLVIVGFLRLSQGGSWKPGESCRQEEQLQKLQVQGSTRGSGISGGKAAEKQVGRMGKRRRRGLRGEEGGRYRGCGRNASVCISDDEGAGECCNGRCVDVGKERGNCGRCGLVCPFMLSCCQGRCLDLSSDPLNCGLCGRCCLGLTCQFGLCDYY